MPSTTVRFHLSSTGVMVFIRSGNNKCWRIWRNWSRPKLLVRLSHKVQYVIIAVAPRYRPKRTERIPTVAKMQKPRCPWLGEQMKCADRQVPLDRKRVGGCLGHGHEVGSGHGAAGFLWDDEHVLKPTVFAPQISGLSLWTVCGWMAWS